ncbi:hypothetical protein CBR_g46633 [Chara braunii]|uniref:DUF659 domain-containing protein n=1 Tax=Chara braunii TaxID=69332 RepID=A0A388M0V6_CHABU|nr:hypothetical protein CBR_g46633 [Chara braunii]|eukprot:GBG88145.1 hypothetical protein CBR_g46633 [Chara braunii]
MGEADSSSRGREVRKKRDGGTEEGGGWFEKSGREGGKKQEGGSEEGGGRLVNKGEGGSEERVGRSRRERGGGRFGKGAKWDLTRHQAWCSHKSLCPSSFVVSCAGRMVKSGSDAIKRHFTELGVTGNPDKGNKKWKCLYCEREVTGTASRLRKHFAEGRWHISNARGIFTQAEKERRLQGRAEAIALVRGVGEVPGDDTGSQSGIGEAEDTPANETPIPTPTSTEPSTSRTRQTVLQDGVHIVTKNEETQRTIDNWMTYHGISFNMVRSPYFLAMIDAVHNAHASFKVASFEETRTTGVSIQRGRVGVEVERLQAREWPTTGCMVQMDGWTDRRQRPHVNIMVSYPAGVVFWKLECLVRREKGAAAYNAILSKAIREIGEKSVVGVIMDNAPVVAVTKFFTNHQKVRDLFQWHLNGKELAKPGATRFATNFIMLTALERLKKALKDTIRDDAFVETIVPHAQRPLLREAQQLVFDEEGFWKPIEKVQAAALDFVLLLRFVDGPGPTISKVYARMDRAVEKLREKECLSQVQREEIEETIMRRWNTMTSPLHCAALFLDTEDRGTNPQLDNEIMAGFWTWVYSWCEEKDCPKVEVELNNWIDKKGAFGTLKAFDAARDEQSGRWWRRWCYELRLLQPQAIRLLGQESSTSGCERNWSLFEAIHSRPRNCLGAETLQTLVFNR